MIKRQLFFAAGLASVGLGAIGVFLPILPTVPFLILAAFCFARSSPKLEAQLMNHPRYGHHLVAWRTKGAVSRRAKYSASVAFAISIFIGLIALPIMWSLIPIGVATLSLTWLWRRPES